MAEDEEEDTLPLSATEWEDEEDEEVEEAREAKAVKEAKKAKKAKEYEEDEDEEGAQKRFGYIPQSQRKKRKGNWKNIGRAPAYCVTYPCECRWKIKFPRDPCPKYKQVRWVVLPLSDRIARLSLPLLRRLLAVWLQYSDKFPPEMRERLMAFLKENYGLTKEFLEKILEEDKKAKEEAEKQKERREKKQRGERGGKKGKKGRKGKRKKGRKKKGKKKKGKKGKKGKKAKKEKKGGKKKKGKNEKDEEPAGHGKGKEKKVKEMKSVLSFKRRTKGGKLPLGWPYKCGSKFILNCISYLSQDPDENFNSRATEYFDVQAMGILEQVCKFMCMPLPDPVNPTQYGETLVIMALNLSNWIAKCVITPAQEIPDDKVDEYLDLRGVIPKRKKKEGKNETSKKGGKKGKKGDNADMRVADEPQEPPRKWDEAKSPVYVPMKTRISKRKISSPDEEGYVSTDPTDETETRRAEPRCGGQSLIDVKQDFLEYLNWYNPCSPEFMYLGPKTVPYEIEMYKIRDADSEDVPGDLRVLNWKIVDYGYDDGYSFIPSPVPQYYPSLRPLRPVRLELLELSGIPEEVVKQSLRFFSPWYIMCRPLKENQNQEATEPVPEQEKDEENVGDEILVPSTPPKVKDSLWGDCKMKEQLEILFHILHLTASMPDLTIEYVFELMEEFCYAVECAEEEENSSEENKNHRKKRTIILEQYYLKFFGKKFRDYNERTPYYMRTICSRLAYYIQLLYEFTAKNLWELQSQPNLPDPVESPQETTDDEQALQDWDEWLTWLLKVTKTCDEWAGWISETVENAERLAEKKKGEFIGPDGRVVKLTQEEWCNWKQEVEVKIDMYMASKRMICRESSYYSEKAKDILPVRHRPVKKFEEEEEMEEEEEEEEQVEGGKEEEKEDGWEDMSNEALENVGEDLTGPDEEDEEAAAEKGTDRETTEEETEYEDLTEND